MNPLEKMLVVRCERLATGVKKKFIKQQLKIWTEAYNKEIAAPKVPICRKKPIISIRAKMNMYIRRANEKGIAFTLTEDMFTAIVNDKCIYCGRLPGGTIDRINSKGGYTLDNCQPACFRCNMMKWTLSHSDFLTHINKINNYANN